MEVKTGAGTLIATFDKGELAGLTVKFSGDILGDGGLGLYYRSGRVISPVERRMTDSEIMYAKPLILKEVKGRQRRIVFD